MNRIYLYLLLVLILAGCSSPGGRYDMSDDQAPDTPLSVEHIEDAHPQYEPYSFGVIKITICVVRAIASLKTLKGLPKVAKPLGTAKNSMATSPQMVRFTTCTR